MNWSTVQGKFLFDGSKIEFLGHPTTWTDSDGQKKVGKSHGLAMSDQNLVVAK